MSRETRDLIGNGLLTAVVITLIVSATVGGILGGRNAASVRKAHVEAGHVQVRSDDVTIWTTPELAGQERAP